MDFFRRRTPSQGSLAADSKVKQTVEALQVLQKTLHELTPPEQAAVQDTLPFAAPEWLEGLALSIRSSSTGRGVVQKEMSSAGTTVTTKEAGDDARMQLTTDAKKVVIVLVGVPARGKSLIGFVLPRARPLSIARPADAEPILSASHKLEHFLCWRGYVTRSFKVGAYRRGENEAGADASAGAPSRPQCLRCQA